MASEDFQPVDAMWTEKYRPKKVSGMVGDFKDKILKYLKNGKTLPHFLFYSKTPGTGKSTLSKAIINELGCDYIVINSSDDRKIDTVRDKVKEFSKTKSSQIGKKRCVFMDEFDGMLKASQDALRNLMETYSENTFFILTCNNINKVIEPIQSRCMTIQFAYPDKDEIKQYLLGICKAENLKHTEDGVMKVVDIHYPSIRNCVSKLQDLYTEELPVTIENIKPINQIFLELWDKITGKDWEYVKRQILSTTVDPRELNTYFWEQALNANMLKIVQITCRNEKDIAWGADPKIIMVTSLIDMVR